MRKAAVFGLGVVGVCLVLALTGPSARTGISGEGNAGTSTGVTAGFVGLTTEKFQQGVGALVASRACFAEYPFTRLCEWAEVFRAIPPPVLDSDVLIAENYEVNPRTTCITPRGELKCKPGAPLPAACCGSLPIQILLSFDTSTSGCSTTVPWVISCSDTICVEARVQDSTGNGLQGVVLQFKLQNNVHGGNTFSGYFVPSQILTDLTGRAFAKFHPDVNCLVQCGGGKSCLAEMIATTPGGAIQSAPLVLQTNIP